MDAWTAADLEKKKTGSTATPTLCCAAGRERSRRFQLSNENELRGTIEDILGGRAPRGLRVWRCDPFEGAPLPPTWTSNGETAVGRRWLQAPVKNGQLVSWALQTIQHPPGPMFVVNGTRRPGCAAFGCNQSPVPSGTRADAPRLCDGSSVCVGQDIRCIQRSPSGRVRFGEVLTVTEVSKAVRCARRSGCETVELDPADLESCFRPARLGTVLPGGSHSQRWNPRSRSR